MVEVDGSLLAALKAWEQAPGVVGPRQGVCEFWGCCHAYTLPLAETRDALEGLIRSTPSRAGRELRRRVREADHRMVGPLDGFWWRDQRYWR
jgi:hypothetical protein